DARKKEPSKKADDLAHTAPVIPGHAEGVSPESITTIHECEHTARGDVSRGKRKVVGMDSGPGPSGRPGMTVTPRPGAWRRPRRRHGSPLPSDRSRPTARRSRRPPANSHRIPGRLRHIPATASRCRDA